MSYEAFKPRVVWADTGGRFRIVQRREDRGEKPDEGTREGTREFTSVAVYVVEETTRKDAMGVPIWTQVSTDDDRALIYAVARDWLTKDRAMQLLTDALNRAKAKEEIERLKGAT